MFKSQLRIAAVLVAPMLVALAPTAAQASVTIGQALDPDDTMCGTGSDAWQTAVADGPAYEFPSDGTVSSWATRSWSDTPSQMSLVILRPNGPNFDVVFVSDLIQRPTSAPTADVVTTLPAPVPVQAGDVLGFQGPVGPDGSIPQRCGKTTNNSGDVVKGSAVAYSDVGDTVSPQVAYTGLRLSLAAEFTAAASPTVTIDQAAGQTDPTDLSPVTFDVKFSEPVTGFDGSDISFAGSTAPGTLSATVSGMGDVYSISVSGMTGPGDVVASIPAGAAVSTAFGLNSEASTSIDNTVTFDPSADLSITKSDGVTSVTAGGAVTYTVTASNAGPSDVSGATVADTLPDSLTGATWTCVGANGGTCTASGTGDVSDSADLPNGGSVTYTVAATLASSAAGTLTNTATVSAPSGVTDPNPGNESATDSDTINPPPDTTAPSATINQAAGQDDPTGAGPITFTVIFSEPVTGFTASDVVLSGTAPGASVASVSGSGTTYTVSVSAMTGAGTVIASVSAGAANDAASNLSTASTSTDNTVTYKPDSDGDGLRDLKEKSIGSDPHDADTDNDALRDGREYGLKSTYPCLDLLKRDTDGDGFADGTEVNGFTVNQTYTTNVDNPGTKYPIGKVRTNPCRTDSDGDGLKDRAEAVGSVINQKVIRFRKDGGAYTIGTRKTNPVKKDTDGDGLADKLEITGGANWRFDRRKSDPTTADTDWGGGKDGREVTVHHTDPTWAGR